MILKDRHGGPWKRQIKKIESYDVDICLQHNSWRKIERSENERSVGEKEIGEEEDMRGAGERKKKERTRENIVGGREREKKK